MIFSRFIHCKVIVYWLVVFFSCCLNFGFFLFFNHLIHLLFYIILFHFFLNMVVSTEHHNFNAKLWISVAVDVHGAYFHSILRILFTRCFVVRTGLYTPIHKCRCLFWRSSHWFRCVCVYFYECVGNFGIERYRTHVHIHAKQ